MSLIEHAQAAELHTHAAYAHTAAAHSHSSGDHLSDDALTRIALERSVQATKFSEAVAAQAIEIEKV